MRRLSFVLSLVGLFIVSTIYPSTALAQGTCPAGASQLVYGNTVEGQIDDSQAVVRYCFEGAEGDVVTIQLNKTSGMLDTYLTLTDASSSDVLVTNDDRSLSSTDSEIVYELEADGIYLIDASRFNQENGSTDGEFSLTLTTDSDTNTELDADTESERPEGCPALYDVISYGETIEGEIDNDDYSYFYCFNGTAGDEVVINAVKTSGGLDTLLILTDLVFDEVYAENDDREIGVRDSRVVLVLPETGSYLITITRYNLGDGTSEGEFELTLQVNDGTFSEDELYTVRNPEPYECTRPLIQQLNATQWLEETVNYDFRLNFGCEGLVAISVLGGNFVAPYSFDDDDNLQVTMNEQNYLVELATDEELTLTGEDGTEFVFTDVGECANSLEEDLNEGVWFLGQNDTFFRLDFMCGGVVIITLESDIAAYTYEVDSGADTLFIGGAEAILWTDVFVLPGVQMSVETDDEPLIFTNILTEIDDGSDADI